MEDKIRILAVDDHQLIIDGIVTSLSGYPKYEITTCNSCDEAFQKLSSFAKTQPFHILFTDLSFDNQTAATVIDGGESLIRKVKEAGIKVKTGVVTGHTETNRVFNVINNLQPDAYILKSQCSGEELNFAIGQMQKGVVFYSQLIHEKVLRRNIVQIQMDEVAIQILKELPKHPKIINLEGKIQKADGSFLKKRTIESKLANLRVDLNATNNTDLVLKAKELGIID